ncbi:MAG TPA: hypothetical protein PLK90_05335 [Clostridiales bacterium]|nr:hypothetical protein [Clostridiales bacterium]HQP69804.1 hypothetical protein [Clostridiales bacterium]
MKRWLLISITVLTLLLSQEMKAEDPDYPGWVWIGTGWVCIDGDPNDPQPIPPVKK